MKKVAFYINNPKMPNCNYCELERGNPGLPGSEYEFLLVSQLLDQRNNGLEIYLFANFKGEFPHSHVSYVSDLESSCELCEEKEIKTLVVDVKYFDKDVMDRYAQLDYIIWAHNFMTIRQLTLFNELNYIKRVVCVGREFMELFRDHLVSLKTSYIYNIFPIREKSYYENLIRNTDNHNVVYMGCLIEEKGFHILAKTWKSILEEIPDAQLYVIGNGRLYDKEASLGKYGQAAPEYEQMFMPYLTDAGGQILDSVHFMGILGEEKYEILSKCKVGVPNPSNESETFCISGLEMQIYGNVITSPIKPAFIDTIADQRYIYKQNSNLALYIINALQSKMDYDKTYEFIRSRFSVDVNILKWEKLFWGDLHIEPISSHWYRLKVLKNILLYIKRILPIMNRIPIIEKWYNAYYMKTNHRERIILFN